MKKNAIFWIREDFRIEHNPALSFASQNHDNVVALFIYNKSDFDKKREAQKWWLYKSLVEFKSELFKYKINLQILEGDEIDILSKIKKIMELNENSNVLVIGCEGNADVKLYKQLLSKGRK